MKDYHVAIDFDGVIHSYTSGFLGYDKIVDPVVPGSIEFIKDLLNTGLNVAIMSTRAATDIGKAAIKEYLVKNGITTAELNRIAITNSKIHAVLYIDDRGYQFDGIFPSINYIRDFKPWYKRT